jgi:hypothetical protein
VFLAIVILGKMFGGSLKGLVPTAACIVSGIWLWMKRLYVVDEKLNGPVNSQEGDCKRLFPNDSPDFKAHPTL